MAHHQCERNVLEWLKVASNSKASKSALYKIIYPTPPQSPPLTIQASNTPGKKEKGKKNKIAFEN